MFRQVSLLAVVLPVMVLAGGDPYFTGDGTSYTLGQVSSGNCNFMYDPGVGENYAALNDEQWDSTLNCGRCAEVSCDDSRCSDTTSTQIVYLVDRCPECKKGDLDLSPTVFKQLTGSDPSRYTIKWQFVDCPVNGNIQYCTKSGSSNFWLAIQPANFANGVASVKIANQDVTMVDSCYYFLLNGGSNVDVSAVDIELTSISGEIVTEKLDLKVDQCIEGTSNFGGSTTQGDISQNSPTTQSTSAPAVTTPTPTSPPVSTTATPVSTPTPVSITEIPVSTPAPVSFTEIPVSTPAPVYATEKPVSTPAPVDTTVWTPSPPVSMTAAPMATTATPTSASESSSSSSDDSSPIQQNEVDSPIQQNDDSSSIQQNEVNNYFNSLKTGNSSSSGDYKAGKVIAADESSSGVSILQSSEAAVEKTPTLQTDSDNPKQTDNSEETKQVSTKSGSSSSGTSPVFIALAVVAVVAGIALAAVAYTSKKKKLNDKRIDRDEAMMRSFDTFSSPVRMDETIAQI